MLLMSGLGRLCVNLSFLCFGYEMFIPDGCGMPRVSIALLCRPRLGISAAIPRDNYHLILGKF